jgi:hypothetical protein
MPGLTFQEDVDRPPLSAPELFGIEVPAGRQRLELAEGSGMPLGEKTARPRNLKRQ